MDTDGEELEARAAEGGSAGTESKSSVPGDGEGKCDKGDGNHRADDQIEIQTDGGGGPPDTKETMQPWDKVSQRIKSLQQERIELRAKAKQAAKAMKKAQRQKRCTAKNAKRLTDDELVQIVMERKVQQQVANQVASAAAVTESSAPAQSQQQPSKAARKG